MSEQTLTLKEKIAVMQAAEDGKTIECKVRVTGKEWHLVDTAEIIWDWDTFTYRVHREPRTLYVRSCEGRLFTHLVYEYLPPKAVLEQYSEEVVKFIEVIDD